MAVPWQSQEALAAQASGAVCPLNQAWALLQHPEMPLSVPLLEAQPATQVLCSFRQAQLAMVIVAP